MPRWNDCFLGTRCIIAIETMVWWVFSECGYFSISVWTQIVRVFRNFLATMVDVKMWTTCFSPGMVAEAHDQGGKKNQSDWTNRTHKNVNIWMWHSSVQNIRLTQMKSDEFDCHLVRFGTDSTANFGAEGQDVEHPCGGCGICAVRNRTTVAAWIRIPTFCSVSIHFWKTIYVTCWQFWSIVYDGLTTA